MIEAKQVTAWEAEWPTFNLGEWLRSWLSRLSAWFGSWKDDGDEEESICTADPEMVAALEFIAALIAEERKEKK